MFSLSDEIKRKCLNDFQWTLIKGTKSSHQPNNRQSICKQSMTQNVAIPFVATTPQRITHNPAFYTVTKQAISQSLLVQSFLHPVRTGTSSPQSLFLPPLLENKTTSARSSGWARILVVVDTIAARTRQTCHPEPHSRSKGVSDVWSGEWQAVN